MCKNKLLKNIVLKYTYNTNNTKVISNNKIICNNVSSIISTIMTYLIMIRYDEHTITLPPQKTPTRNLFTISFIISCIKIYPDYSAAASAFGSSAVFSTTSATTLSSPVTGFTSCTASLSLTRETDCCKPARAAPINKSQ